LLSSVLPKLYYTYVYMKEVHTGIPETQQPKSNVIDFEAARQKRQAGQEPQVHRPLTAPPSEADREEPRHQLSQEGSGATSYPTIEDMDKLAAEQGWEAVADKFWGQLGKWWSADIQKYITCDPTQRKLPDKADTREQITARLARLNKGPLSDQQWQEWERMRVVDPATLSPQQWRHWQDNPASITEERVREIEVFEQETEASYTWMKRFEEAERKKRWEEVAIPEYAKKLGREPVSLTSEERKTLVDYDPYAFECAQAAGLNPLTLTPEQQKELAGYYPGTTQSAGALGVNPLTLTTEERIYILNNSEKIVASAKKLGLDPRTLTAQERHELGGWGRFFTDEERKERAKWKAEAEKARAEWEEGAANYQAGFKARAERGVFIQGGMEWYRNLSSAEQIQFLHDALLEIRRENRFDNEATGGKFSKFIVFLFEVLMELISPANEKNSDKEALVAKSGNRTQSHL
jgi:hypothetical protein